MSRLSIVIFVVFTLASQVHTALVVKDSKQSKDTGTDVRPGIRANPNNVESSLFTNANELLYAQNQNGWIPQTMMHVIELVEQLHVKMADMELIKEKVAVLDVLKEKVAILDVLNEKVSNIDTEIDLLKEKLFELEGSKLDAKLASSERNIIDKLDRFDQRLEDKLESHRDHLEASIEKSHKETNSAAPSMVSPSPCDNKEPSNHLGFNISAAVSISVEALRQDIRFAQAETRQGLSNVAKNMQDNLSQIILSINSTAPSDSNARSLDKLSELLDQWGSNNSSAVSSQEGNPRISLDINIPNSLKDQIPSIYGSSGGRCFSLFKQSPAYHAVLPSPLQSLFPDLVVYPRPGGEVTVPLLCDAHTHGGGWILIQRRSTGSVNFHRDWQNYKTGFGSYSDDFWLGLDAIHNITRSGVYELRVDLKHNSDSGFAHYTSFSIAEEGQNYTLSLGRYDGTAGDSLIHHRGMKFTTHDRDNDIWGSNCASSYHGGWWFKSCHRSNLNGKWNTGDWKGMVWKSFRDKHPVSFSEMKIRRVDDV